MIAKTDRQRVLLIGTSAGGALVLKIGLLARHLGLPMLGGIASGTPMSDSTKTGDTFHTNAMLNNVLVSTEDFCDSVAAFYANGHDLKYRRDYRIPEVREACTKMACFLNKHLKK